MSPVSLSPCLPISLSPYLPISLSPYLPISLSHLLTFPLSPACCDLLDRKLDITRILGDLPVVTIEGIDLEAVRTRLQWFVERERDLVDAFVDEVIRGLGAGRRISEDTELV